MVIESKWSEWEGFESLLKDEVVDPTREAAGRLDNLQWASGVTADSRKAARALLRVAARCLSLGEVLRDGTAEARWTGSDDDAPYDLQRYLFRFKGGA